MVFLPEALDMSRTFSARAFRLAIRRRLLLAAPRRLWLASAPCPPVISPASACRNAKSCRAFQWWRRRIQARQPAPV